MGLDFQQVLGDQVVPVLYTCLPVYATPNLGSKNLGNSGFACVGLPCARFFHVDRFHKKAAFFYFWAQSRAFQTATLRRLWPTDRHLTWKDQLLRTTTSEPKTGVAKRPQFWGRSFTPPIQFQIVLRELGPFRGTIFGTARRPHFLAPNLSLWAQATGSRWLRTCPCSSHFGQRRAERTGACPKQLHTRLCNAAVRQNCNCGGPSSRSQNCLCFAALKAGSPDFPGTWASSWQFCWFAS